MSRNYGLGTRSMGDAGRIAMQNTNSSLSTISDVGTRFQQFAEFAKENGIGRMERVTSELVIEYGKGLADRVDGEEIKPATAQNLLSAVNSVMKSATDGAWRTVSPTKDCSIANRDNVRSESTVTREHSTPAIASLSERQAAIAGMCRELGLRSKEACLINAKTALNQAISKGKIIVVDGTKGGRSRQVPIHSNRQIQALKEAAIVQDKDRSMIPPEQSWKQFQAGELRDARESLQAATGHGLHELRSAYACERYTAITGHEAPCNGGQIADKSKDLEARQQIASELGHGRIDVTTSYLGGRS